MKYRSRTDIISAILRIVSNGGNGPVHKTRIMYGAFLSHAQAGEYIDFLLDKGLLARESGTAAGKEGGECFVLTKKGLQFLHIFEEMTQLISVSAAQMNYEIPASEATAEAGYNQ